MNPTPTVLTRLLALVFALNVAAVASDAIYSEVSVEVELPEDQVWQRMSNFAVAHTYVPNLARTEIVSSRKNGIGAHRRVYDLDGDYLEETIIEWDEGVGFVIELHQGDEPMAPFKRAEFSYAMEAAALQRTLVVLRMTVELPLGSVGQLLGEWFILPVMNDNLVQVAAGLKHYYETGRPASNEDREKMSGAVTIDPGGIAP